MYQRIVKTLNIYIALPRKTEQMTTKVEQTDEGVNSLAALIAKKDAKIEQLERELEEARRRRAKADREYERLARKAVNTVMDQPEKAQEAPPAHEHVPIGSLKAPLITPFCPDCGIRNPNFKEEARCATCGMHLGPKSQLKITSKEPDGSIKVLQEGPIAACPNCGGQRFTLKPLRVEVRPV
jgi:DNA repair exonuclease SbcCD ATPase subunit